MIIFETYASFSTLIEINQLVWLAGINKRSNRKAVWPCNHDDFKIPVCKQTWLNWSSSSACARSRGKLQIHDSAEFCCGQRSLMDPGPMWMPYRKDTSKIQDLSMLTAPESWKVEPLMVQLAVLFQFKIITPCPTTTGPKEKSLHIFLVSPLIHWKAAMRAPAGAFSSPGIWRMSLCLLQ